MDVIMVNRESKYETSHNKGDDIVHLKLCNVIRGSDSEEREEKKRRHGAREIYTFCLFSSIDQKKTLETHVFKVILPERDIGG
ncbi:hypothetical protein FEM48_Zijuj10G0115000 [Ziziphus jujuba var. spinosa]|uniref:Uncharacterized protein n=1 Tax=Ziziphus jujuba var. spinosa TaxID=714518 RepID=A0A978UN45_ZIZJJ|nr:hypothetical protein FEM48_Zijuj10G0115000 [Ziziphus jujuba var. spinosa]